MEEHLSQKKGNFFDSFISNILNLVYSKEKKTERILILLTVIGFILRLFTALNEGVLPDDMLYASQSAGIIDSGVLSTHSNPPLFFYLTDLAYKLFGYTTFASRFWPLIFGTLLIPLSFLLTRKLFDNKKVALAVSFFVAFSNFLIRTTYTEADLVVLFFSMFAVYFGLEYLENKKTYFIMLSSILFGLAALTKYSAPFFILSFLVFSLYYLKTKKEKILTKKNFKILLIFVVIILIFSLPFLAFNYFLYKDKGIVDVYFSRVIHTEKAQQLYAGLGGQNTTFFQNLLNISFYVNIYLIYYTDIIMLLFGILGFYFIIKNKQKKLLYFLIIFLMIPFPLQTAGSNTAKHFVFIPFLFSIPAGIALEKCFSKFKKYSYFLIFLLVIALVIHAGYSYGIPTNYFTKSDTSQLKSFINNNVKDNDLIIIDSRFYTAEAFWLSSPHHQLSFLQFPDFYNYNQNISGNKIPVETYVIECIPDDCGWGWVHDNQDLNKSSEYILSYLKNNSQFVKNIKSYKYFSSDEVFGKKEIVDSYNIYKLTLNINPQLLEQSDYISNFYFVPYLYKNMNNYVFNYNVDPSMSWLQKFSLFIIYLSIFFSVLSIFLLMFLLINKKYSV